MEIYFLSFIIQKKKKEKDARKMRPKKRRK